MIPTTRALVLAALTGAVLVPGCGGGMTATDSGGAVDSGGTPDAGIGDAGARDSGGGTDSGGMRDAEPDLDASDLDAFVATDARIGDASATDARIDAFVATDAFVAIDAPITGDAGADGGTPADGGGASDAGSDAGSTTDGGGAGCNDSDACTTDTVGVGGACVHTPIARRLYAARGGNVASSLYVLDPATGAATVIGPTGMAITGMAQHPITGVVYGVTTTMSPASPLSLVRIDTATGATTLIAATGDATIADITFASDGTLYGWLEFWDDLAGGVSYDDDLVVIDVATAAITVLGDSGLDTYGSGLAFAPDGRLFFTGGGNLGNLSIIDRVTGLETSVIATLMGGGGDDDDPINALAFDPSTGVLYGTENVMFAGAPANLISIDTTTAAITVRGPNVARMDAIVWACP